MWDWVTAIVLVISIIYLYLKHIYSYWKRHGFEYIEPTIPYGNLVAIKNQEKSFGMAISDLYEATTKPIIGIYLFFRPALLVRDAEIARDILTKNFNSFHDRGVYVNDKDPASENLFALEGQKWKNLRAKLAPTFTSGKLKNMFSKSVEVGKEMQDYLWSILPENGDEKTIEMKDIMYRFGVDVIGSTIFGLEVNSFKNQTNEFFMIKDEINSSSFINYFKSVGEFLVPWINKVFHLLHIPNTPVNFMVNIVQQTIEHRKKENVIRNDLMQSLIVETDNLKSMSIEQCGAQAFVFYIAGLETTASTIAFCLYELAQNKDVYDKLEKDIDETLAQHNGEITYDSIQDMKYLEFCVLETIRKYPGMPILNRLCTEDYQAPDNIGTIRKGTPIIISLIGMLRDEKYFPNPLKFDPERFKEGEKNYNEAAYMPFGDGPRHCIGLRMGKVNTKLAIIMILRKFKIEAMEKKEIEIDNYAVGLMPKGGINLKISKKLISSPLI